MKKFNFNPNVLSAGVALALGFGIANGVSASTASNGATATEGVSITNKATATYSVDGVTQPEVTSNAVIVNVNEIGNFTLVATQGKFDDDDKNENIAISSPNGKVTFENTLTNLGNVTDTYTINLSDTAAGIISGVTDKFSFTDVTTTPITVTIKKTDGSTTTTSITSGGQVTLLPGESAKLSYTLTADGSGVGGDSGLATITATSQYISKNTKATDSTKPAVATLTNEDQAILKLPVFAITKTAANSTVDLNAAAPSIDYTITVKNDKDATYAADAINALIQDKLPTGLTVKDGVSGIKVSSTDSSTPDGSTPQLITAPDGRTIIAVNNVDLKVGETITITFTALVDKTKVDKTQPLVNNADVYDNFDNTPVTPGDTPTSSISDSTSTPNQPSSKVPNDPTGPGTGGDTPAIVNFSDRNITLTGTATKELPPTSASGSPATYTETITNNGNNPESGLTFTITNPSTTDNITPKNVVYTDPTGVKTTLTPDSNGVYTIPGSIAAGKSGTITYDVVTTGATIGSSETNTITLTPAAVANSTTPVVPAVTNTTNVQGMTLVKEQALDANCDGTADAAFAQSPITATPGQCVIYKITASNSFTTKSLTGVVIGDTASQWNTKATYVNGSIKDSANGATVAPGTTAQSSSLTIAPGASAWLQFGVKINGATN